MANTYAWDFPALDAHVEHTDAQDPTNTETNVVYNVHYRYTASVTVDGEDYTATSIGTQSLEVEDLSTFSAFADLTASVVEGWVEAAMGAETVQGMKDGLDADLLSAITPTTITLTLPS
jgi:hypothetical protein